MENIRLLFSLYFRPTSAISEFMDKGSWIFVAAATLIISLVLAFTINSVLTDTYATNRLESVYSDLNREEIADLQAEFGAMIVTGKRDVPVAGTAPFVLFSINSWFVAPLIILSIFYFPITILLASLIGRLGNPGVVFQRDYATFSACGLLGWTAAHLPAALAGLALSSVNLDGSFFWVPWILSGLLFGFFMTFILRTVFGLEYTAALVTVIISIAGYCIGSLAFQAIGPWVFSPFFLILAILFFGGFLRGQLSGLGNSMRQKRDFKRHLQNATVNPNDADAHVQLGLIYAQRRQNDKAREHFEKAFRIDNEEIDANYQLGIIARKEGEYQKAIEHFSVVVEQNDRFSLSEVWREIGATYLEAGQTEEAKMALEKFVARREYDSEGQYYLGILLKKVGETEKANEHFRAAIEAVKTAPYYRKKELSAWAKLAAKEIG